MAVPFRIAADFEVRPRDYEEELDFAGTALEMAKRNPARIPDGPHQGDIGEAIGGNLPGYAPPGEPPVG